MFHFPKKKDIFLSFISVKERWKKNESESENESESGSKSWVTKLKKKKFVTKQKFDLNQITFIIY